MTDFELPKWARIVDGRKLVRCPRCNDWLYPTRKESILACKKCEFKTYEKKIEAFWAKNEQKVARFDKLESLGMAPSELYFCTLCRVHHEAGSKIGFMHLENRGEKRKLRVCTIPNCEQILTGKQKKFACKKNCSEFVKWQQTCKKCGYFFGRKGDGYQIRRLCFECDAKDKGATLQDWEDLGLDATCTKSEFTTALVKLRLSGKMTEDMQESAFRILQFFSKRS